MDLQMSLQEFTVPAGGEQPAFHCVFHTLVTGISLRHSDTVDVQFLVNGKPVVIALAHAGIARFRAEGGNSLNDTDVIRMAALFLKGFLETGEWIESRILSVSLEQTLALARRVAGPSPPA